MDQDEKEYALLDACNDMESTLADAGIRDGGHDDWRGCAGVEIRDAIFEPYPHHWDYSLGWCRVKWGLMLIDTGLRDVISDIIFYELNSKPYDESEDIPLEIFGRAVGNGWRYYA